MGQYLHPALEWDGTTQEKNPLRDYINLSDAIMTSLRAMSNIDDAKKF